MDPSPAIPPYTPPPLPASIVGSSRRILWIIGLFRAVCGALLLGLALLLDLRALDVVTPNSFITAASLYFVFGLASFGWIQQEKLTLPIAQTLLALLSGDIFFIALVMVAGGSNGAPLPILLFPQLAASGWLLRTQTAFFHAALAAIVLLGLETWRLAGGGIGATQLFQTALICLGYFAMVGTAVVIGRYTKASEDLAAQRGIDVANLEQVNRLIIQDMQDGVLVVDLNGVVRGHNAQVTRLLGGFGRMRGGMRLAEFSATLHDYWRRWDEDQSELLPPFKVLWSTSASGVPVAPDREESLLPLTRWLRELGNAATANEFTSAMSTLQAATRHGIAATSAYDVLLMPTVALPPVPIGYFSESGDPAEEFDKMTRFTPWTAVFNMTGQPAVNVPLHWSPDGLPIGIHLVTGPWQEALLLRVAAQLESAMPWESRRPPI